MWFAQRFVHNSSISREERNVWLVTASSPNWSNNLQSCNSHCCDVEYFFHKRKYITVFSNIYEQLMRIAGSCNSYLVEAMNICFSPKCKLVVASAPSDNYRLQTVHILKSCQEKRVEKDQWARPAVIAPNLPHSPNPTPHYVVFVCMHLQQLYNTKHARPFGNLWSTSVSL